MLQQYNNLHHGDSNLTVNITLWSDDHEPNGTKDNRGSIWTLTVTIETKDCNGYSTLNTYPISISTKGAPHDIVFKRLADDMCMLSSSTNFYVYVKTASGNLKVNTLLSSYLADSPEKRSILAMTLGNGVYAQWFGYSANLRACHLIFSACSRCLLALESGHVPQ